MRIKHLFSSFLLILLSLSSWAQLKLSELQPSLHGFVKTDFWWDTRQVAGAREDLFALYPLAPDPDINGYDLNATAGFNFSAITSRINFSMGGGEKPVVFGGKARAFIEADFSGTGNPDINGFRLRHAYLSIEWEHSKLLLGQYWHPSFVAEVFPTVISLNTGAPFQPFIRNPQVRYSYQTGRLEIIGALLSQRDYANDGPEGRSAVYIRRTAIPNSHLQLRFRSGSLVAGLASDYKVIQPRLSTVKDIHTEEKLGSWALMAFARHSTESASFAMKGILGQNMSEHLMMGGYAVATLDTLTGYETYTPSNHLSFWANYVYGKEKRFGIFTGYVQNLGTSDVNTGTFYGRGFDIDKLYRASAFGAVRKGPVELCLELEYTQAWYGTPDNKGIVMNAEPVSNVRILFTGFYFF